MMDENVPGYPTRNVSNPFVAKLSAWYIMRGLRPMSPSTRMAAVRKAGLARGLSTNHVAQMRAKTTITWGTRVVKSSIRSLVPVERCKYSSRNGTWSRRAFCMASHGGSKLQRVYTIRRPTVLYKPRSQVLSCLLGPLQTLVHGM